MDTSPWAWHPHPDVWLLLVVLGTSYALAATRGRPAAAGPVSRLQIVSFGAGMATLWVAADWPVHDLAERYLLWVHMVQHLILTLVMPPLLLLGMPAWMLRRLIGPALPLVRTLARPLPATLAFNAVVLLSHWPSVVNTVLRHEPLHFAVHVVLVGTAMIMWLPVVSPLPAIPRLPEPSRMVYVFVQSIVPTFPASFLTFAEVPLYRVYAEAPRAFGTSAVADQQVAGAMMKLGGGAVLWTLIIVLFFRWYGREQRADRQETELRWSDVERQLAATPAPPEPPIPT